ncbi:MAG: ArsR family transcriptional regulator [Candidatus Atabeyarchaeum deiterrae]
MSEIEVSGEEVAKIAKALASKTRWEIMKLLQRRNVDVSRIAQTLYQTEANISAQIKILEDAGLVRARYQPGVHGVRKICEPAVEKLTITFR